MATFHCQVRNGGVGHACAHADYISREGKYGTARLKEQLVYTESGNLPQFTEGNARDYWQAADDFTRINGKTYYEIEAALPNELTHQENIELVHEFVALELGKDKAYTFAIHDKPAANDPTQSQVHVHIMFSNKMQDGIERSREKFFRRYDAASPDRMGARNDDRFNGKNQKGRAAIAEVRQSWEKIINRAYEQRGMEQRVSCKSLADQRAEALANGDKDKAYVLNRTPQVHLGPKLTYSTRREAVKAIDKVHYFMHEAHPKARHNFIAQQQKETALAIVKLRKERILTLQENLENKGVVRSIRDGIAKDVLEQSMPAEKVTAARELGHGIDEQRTLNSQELKAAQRELKEFRSEKENYQLSDKKIMQLANDIYTKGASKKVRQEAAALTSIKKTWQHNMDKCLAELAKQPDNEKLLQAKQQLLVQQRQLEERDQQLRKEISRIRASLARPKAVEAVQAIQKSLRERVDVARQRIADRQQRIDNLRTQNFVLDETKQSLNQASAFARIREELGLKMDWNRLDVQRIKLIKDPHERRAALQAKIVELRQQSRAVSRQAQSLGRRRVNPEFAYNAAKSVYTHGQYKKIAQVEREIDKIKAELAVHPGEGMTKQHNQLAKLERENAARKERVSAVLATPHAQRSIERMAQSRISRSQIMESRQTVLQEHVAELKELKREAMDLRNAATQEIQLQQQQSVSDQAISRGLGAVKSGLNIQEANVMGSMNASIGGDDPYKFRDKSRGHGYEH